MEHRIDSTCSVPLKKVVSQVMWKIDKCLYALTKCHGSHGEVYHEVVKLLYVRSELIRVQFNTRRIAISR